MSAYFHHRLADLHYYTFGNGPLHLLCFHGYGMHGRQFKILEPYLGERYTCYGFDLFFHKGTRLHNDDLPVIKKGISKEDLSGLFADFCAELGIDRFSVIAYSMGTYYSTALAEELAARMDEFIAIAPSSLKPGALLSFLGTNALGNRLFEKMALSDNALFRLVNMLRKLHVIDEKSAAILHAEIATPELRFGLYACATYLKRLLMDERAFVTALSEHAVKTYFIFGERDRSYPPKIGKAIAAKIDGARHIVLNEDHQLINRNLGAYLADTLK